MMVLVIGGRAQGKTEYIQREFCVRDEDIGGDFGKNKVLLHLEKLVWERGGESVLRQLDQWISGDCIVCCDEVGMGIVPLDRKEREFRDDVGKTLCALAKRADRVIRVFAGIGQRIK